MKKINKKYKISKPEVFDFTTNGATTKGFVIYPVDYDKNKTYPAILDIHGGPKTVYGNVSIMKCKFGLIWDTSCSSLIAWK